MGTHLHHIIPRHMGGSNDLENLIELTVEEHAEAHKILYEKHGHWQDHIAWKALSGQINSDDIRREIVKYVWTGKKHTETSRKKIKEARSKQIFTDETRKKMSKSLKGRKITWETNATTVEANLKRSQSLKGRPKPIIECPHCGKIGGASSMKQWHFDNCKGKLECM